MADAEMEPVVLRPVTERDAAQRAADVGWRPADDGAVLYDGTEIGLHRLNGSAGLLWQLLDSEMPLGDLIDDLADASGAPREVVRDDVLATVDALRVRALAQVPGDPQPIAATVDPGGEPKYLGVPPNF